MSNPLTDADTSILTISYEHSLDTLLNSRSIYGFLNLFGDLGGLSSIIFLVGGMIS